MSRNFWVALAATLLFQGAAQARGLENTSMRFPSGIGALNLFMRHQPPSSSREGPPVLILHGATFPSGNAAAWKIDGHSWMDDLAQAGYDVYALDFLGYGESDRYPGMASEESSGQPWDNVETLTQQVNRAVEEILRTRKVQQVNLIAHSAGTFAAAYYAQLHPERVARLVLFGPPAPFQASAEPQDSPTRYFQMSAADEIDAFEQRVRQSARLDMTMIQKWAAAYLATDPAAGQRVPPSVRVPAGMLAASDEAHRLGRLPYDPGRITTPVLVIVGQWDEVAPPEQGHWLFEHLASPLKRFVELSEGGHRLHLERSRFQLYRETESFLHGADVAD